jgi:hypothetical protein
MSDLLDETEIEPVAEDPWAFSAEESGEDSEAPYGRNKDGSPRKKRGRKPGTSTGTGTRRSAKFEKSVIADKITEYLAVPVSVASPLAASVIDDRSEKVAESLILLAGHSPRFAKGLAGFMKGSAYAELIMFPIAVTVAFAVDYQRISPYSFPAKQFKIDQFYEMLVAEADRPAEYRQQESVGTRSGLV